MVLKEKWMIEDKVHGEGFILEKRLLSSYVSEQGNTGNEFRDKLSRRT